MKVEKSESKENITIDIESLACWLECVLFDDTQWISDYARMSDVLCEAQEIKHEKIDFLMQGMLSDFQDKFISEAIENLKDDCK